MTSPSARKSALVVALASGLLFASTQIQLGTTARPAAGPGGAAAAPAQRGGRGAIDPRVQQRTYLFTDTNEQLPYAVFVSSKVSKDKKNPLIVALHGLGGDQNTMMRANALQLAEEGGYIMVGPMGYNSSGWYGTPSTMAAGTGGAAGGVGFGGGRGAWHLELARERRGTGGPGGGAWSWRGRGAGPGGPGAGAGGGRGAALSNVGHAERNQSEE